MGRVSLISLSSIIMPRALQLLKLFNMSSYFDAIKPESDVDSQNTDNQNINS